MDNKRMWLTMAVVLGLTFLWIQVVRPYLMQKYHWVDDTNKPNNPPANVATTTPSSGPTTSSIGSATTGPTTAGAQVVKGGPARQIVIGDTMYDPKGIYPNGSYPLGLQLSTRGASLLSATLSRFKQEYEKSEPYVFQKPYDAPSPLAAALATRSLVINGGPPIALEGLDWQVDGTPTTHSVTFAVDVSDPAGAKVRLTKTYELRDEKDKGAGYEMLVSYSLHNLSGAALKARLAFNGTTAPQPENNRDLPEVVAGFDGGSKYVALQHSPTASIKSEAPLDILTMDKQPLLWSGMVSAYFDAIVRATDAAGNRLPLSVAKAMLLNPEEQDSAKHQIAISYETSDLDLAANASATVALNIYLGPKSREIIKSNYYSSYPLGYDETLVLRSTSGIAKVCGLCTWDWLINVLVSMLQLFHVALRDWGLSIIALVCIVRLILHPITKRSQISMSKMTKLGPEMERLKKKYGDDAEGFKKAQVQFYKEQGIAPFLGCLPMFLQMPIWIALWSSLQSTFEMRHAKFLGGYSGIHDLSQPDRLIPFHHLIQFWFFKLDAINVLPILMAIVFYIQQKFQPQPVAATPEQQQQQKMMKWMSIFLFPLFLYSQPSGLNLYIFTSTLIGIVESKRIRDHIKEREEREKAGVVIVDAEPTKEVRGGAPARGPKNAPPEKPAGGIAGFFAKLQNMADDARKEQEKRAKKGKR